MLIAADFTCEAYEVLVAAELVIVIILIITIRTSTKLKGFRFLIDTIATKRPSPVCSHGEECHHG